MPQLTPYILRDLRQGVYRKSSISSYLMPANTVSHSMNVNFDTIIGSVVVRNGTTKIGTTGITNKVPLGLTNFLSGGGVKNLIIAVYPTAGAGTGVIYYYDVAAAIPAWTASSTTTLNITAKNRFASIGNMVFITNGVDSMKASSDGATWVTTNCLSTSKPTLLIRAKNRLLAAGDPTYKDRVYFSSIISPVASPFITWSENATTGDWIDINPDDGGNVTGFAQTSSTVLVFKSNGMYRLSVISKTVDADNIFNIGAVSQEAIVECQGVVYFFSGQDIRRTSGDFPEQISRLGVQDFIDAIPQTSWTSVCSGTDGFNIYFFIGDITLETSRNEQETFTNVVLKFSPRDQSWSVHSYADTFKFFSKYVSSSGIKLIGQDSSGDIQTLNLGTTDNTAPIYYDLRTQEIELGDRSHVKKIQDKIVVFMNNGIDGQLLIRQDDGDFKPVKIGLNDRVNIGRNLDIEARYLTFRWNGLSSGTAPIFEGIEIEKVNDIGTQ